MGLLNKNKEVEPDEGEITTVTVEDNGVAYVDTGLSFEEHLKRFRALSERNRRNSLKVLWEIGAFVNILKEKKAYGEKTVEAFVEELNDVSVSIKEVYKYAQFADRYTPEQVNTLLRKSNIGWGAVCNLIRVKDPVCRLTLEDKLDSGELPAGKLQGVVSSFNKQLQEGAKDPSNKTGAGESVPPPINTCTVSFKKMNNFLENLLTTTDSCAKDIQDLNLICADEARYERAVDYMEKFKGLLPQVRKALQSIEDMLNKTI